MKKQKFIMSDILSNEEELNLVRIIQENGYTVIGRNNQKIVNTGIEYDFQRPAVVDLLAGWSCPAADLCHSRVVKDIETGTRHTEDLGKFRCYATKSEVAYTAVYDLHASNMELSKSDMFPLIVTYLIRLKKIDLMRIHSAGDLYSFGYFMKWIQICKWNPEVVFFGYTKQATFIHWLQKNPVSNLSMVYSMGGKLDEYALQHDLPSCTVVTNDYLYHDANTTIEKLDDGNYLYTYKITHKYGNNVKIETVTHVSSLYLEYGTFYNPIKSRVENLSCMHDTSISKVDDFERILRQESFGIIFH